MSSPRDGSAAAHRPVFIFSSGMRCGSTLLQRLLNSHPDVLVWGETGGAIGRLLDDWDYLAEWEARFRADRLRYLEQSDGWTANMCPAPEAQQRAVQEYLLALWARSAGDLGKTVWGFKEVTCDAVTAVRLMGLFPRATVIHLTRDPVDVLVSLLRWTKHIPQDTPRTGPIPPKKIEHFDRWVAINRSFLALGSNAPWLVSVRYEDLVRDPLWSLQRLWPRTGIDPAGIDLTVLDRRHAGPKTIDTRPMLVRSRLTEEERALLGRPETARIAAELGYAIHFEDSSHAPVRQPGAGVPVG